MMADAKADKDFDPVDLLRSINEDMPPEQAVAQIAEYHHFDYNGTKALVVEARRKLLKKEGYDPKDWVFYSNATPLPDETIDQMMATMGRNFPKGVEFLVIQGSFIGGVTGVPGVSSAWGIAGYRYHDDDYSVFVRVRPKQLNEGTSAGK